MPSLRSSKSQHFNTRSNKLKIPDLISGCPFELRLNPHGEEAGNHSDAWLYSQGGLTAKKLMSLRGLKCGLLAAMTYPDAPAPELRVCCDFLTFLFHLDDLSDDMDKNGTQCMRKVVIGSMCDPLYEAGAKVGRMARDIWSRLALSASFGTKARFISTFDLFFRAISQQALDRREGKFVGLEDYIEFRRDTSGCRPCWVLIEYANGLDLPDSVTEHEAFITMGDATNDLVSWSNDIFSFKKEGARDDSHNMIPIVMRERNLPLQDAVDFVGEMCGAAIQQFIKAKRRMPSHDHGGHLDRQVNAYIRGLEDWIVGSLHWSFESARYFGKEGKGVKKSRVVKLVRDGEVEEVSVWDRLMCHSGRSVAVLDLA